MNHRYRSSRQPRLGVIALALALTGLSTPSHALDYVWTAGDGLWTDSSKWTLLGVPGANDSATINNTGTGRVLLNGTFNLGQLTMNPGASLGGAGTLSAGSLVFNGGKLGTTFEGPGATVNVAGSTDFNGAAVLSLDYTQTLKLNGNSSWGIGNGRLVVASAYQTGSNTYASAVLRIASGTTFSDLGAAGSTGFKVLGGGDGNVHNDGTYSRSGLGTTWVRGLNNTGTLNINSGIFGFDPGNWLNYSSGQVNVAQGAELQLAATTFSAGTINNAGKVTVIGNDNYVQAGASISGVWQVNAGRLFIEGTQHLDLLTINGGTIAGEGNVNIGQLAFNSGILQTGFATPGGAMSVQGTTTFNGTDNQSVALSHTLNLNGNSTWTAGNGRLIVDGAYQTGNSAFPSAALRIASGTTFTDLGAAGSTGFKVLGGGTVLNNGTYTRSGPGTTWVRGLNNTGTLNINSGTFGFDPGNWLNYSSGQINVAQGAELQLAATTFSAGAINNAGKVTVIGNDNYVRAGASISGVWQVNAGRLFIEGSQQLDALTINGGNLAGQGNITVGQLSFNGGKVGNTSAGGGLYVNGPATFNGADLVWMEASHTLNLNGNSTWTAGNGRFIHGATLSIASVATFVDQGAASEAGIKTLGYGTTMNQGVLLRTGLGSTEAYGLINQGLLHVERGALGVDDRFTNTGQVTVNAGAVLYGLTGILRNDGLMGGTGTLRTLNAASALTNAGVLTPAGLETTGTLTIDGDLALTAAGALRIDLDIAGQDLLAITSDVSLGGTLQVWAAQVLPLHPGDSFVVATYGQRLGSSTFADVQWLGPGANPFSVEYNAHDITLRVTSAVPEPGNWALWLCGLFLLAPVAWRYSTHVNA